MTEAKYEDEEDFDGQDVESSYLRRMYRILNMPTGDWASRSKVMEKAERN